MSETVAVFKPYPFHVGQKIRVDGSSRAGDWEVAAVGDKKITLRCPISGKQYEWATFCYLVEEEADAVWPKA